MYVTELDRPEYLVVAERGFFDKELGITDEQLASVLEIQEEAKVLQEWLQEVYYAGDRSHKVEAPSWLVELSERKQEQPDTAQVLSKTLHLQPKPKASSSSTRP